MRAGEPLQAITAIGQIKSREPYAFDMGGGFAPTRRNVDFKHCGEAPIHPLVGRQSFIRNKHSWGYVFRFGQIEIRAADFQVIVTAIGVPAVAVAEAA
jgi:hypothetical protein